MKHLKVKLLTAVAMLLVAATMMGTATYAWFTISTNPEVKDLTATVVTNENIEIAYFNGTAITESAAGDTGKNNTWGNLITNNSTAETAAGTYTKDLADLDKTLRPVTLAASGTKLVLSSGATASDATAGTFYYPIFSTTNNDGRPDYFVALTEKPVTGTGFGNLTDASGKIYGYYVDMKIRTNVEGDFQISDAEERSTSGTTGAGSLFTINATGLDSAQETLCKNIRVAIKFNGGTTTALAIDKTEKASGASNYTTTFKTGTNNKIGTFIAEAPATSSDKALEAVVNTAVDVRIYVYLEGANVKNAAASIDTAALGAALNLQFQNSNVDNSMDGQS